MSSESATPAPATDTQVPATDVASGTGRKSRELWFPAVALASIGLAVLAFVANLTGLGLLGERLGFIGLDMLGPWWMIGLGVLAHAGFIYATYLMAWMVYPAGHVGALLVAAAFPLSTVFYIDPTVGLGGILCILAVRFAEPPTYLLSAVFAFLASLFTPAAMALVVVYIVGILSRKGKTFAWLGLITAFVTVELNNPLHQLATATWETYAPLGGFLVASLVVWATTRKTMPVVVWLVGVAALIVAARGYTVHPLLVVIWLPVAVLAAGKMRKVPLAVLALSAFAYGAWVSAATLGA